MWKQLIMMLAAYVPYSLACPGQDLPYIALFDDYGVKTNAPGTVSSPDVKMVQLSRKAARADDAHSSDNQVSRGQSPTMIGEFRIPYTGRYKLLSYSAVTIGKNRHGYSARFSCDDEERCEDKEIEVIVSKIANDRYLNASAGNKRYPLIGYLSMLADSERRGRFSVSDFCNNDDKAFASAWLYGTEFSTGPDAMVYIDSSELVMVVRTNYGGGLLYIEEPTSGHFTVVASGGVDNGQKVSFLDDVIESY